MTTRPVIPQQRASRAELVAISEKEIADVALFIAVQSRRTRESVDSHLRWFLLENPARQPQSPVGFGLRAADQLVGCILCSPQLFRCEQAVILLMGSSSFYVDDRYRGHGGRIFLQYCRLGNQWPLFGTSANAEAAALWKAAGASPIPNTDTELFGVLRWPPLAEEFAHRRHSSRILSHLARSPISHLASLVRPLKIDYGSSAELLPLASAEQVNDLTVHHHSAKLTALRDLPYIRWRYFSGRDATVATFAFRSRRPDREILVTVNQRARGYRGQINTLNVLDVYPEVPPEEWLQIVGALTARYEGTVDTVVLRSQDPNRQKLFCERGFQRRTFHAPNGWFLDKARLLPTHDWYPVPADGDWLI
ncbi:MAG: hypothetical protein WAM69_08230 [Candidatus Sulfotelmatobacter sp.]